MKVPKVTVEVSALAPCLALRLRFHDKEVPEELGVFLAAMIEPQVLYEAFTPRLLSFVETRCDYFMRRLVESGVLWEESFSSGCWRLDEDKLRQLFPPGHSEEMSDV